MADDTTSHVHDQAASPAGHVLHVADREIVARFGPMLAQVLQGLSATGLRVSFLTDETAFVDRLEGRSVDCVLVPHLQGWRGWRLQRILPERFTPAPDVVHLWGTAGLWWLKRWLSKTASAPLLVHALGVPHIESLLRRGLRHNQHVAVLSASLADPLLHRFPFVADRCHTTPPAVAPPLRPPAERDANRTLSVLCVSRLEADCGLEVLIDAVGQLRRSHCDVQVALIGAGRWLGPLWRRIHAQEARACVSLINEPELWERILPEVDVCVVPARQPEPSLAPLLAMALGKTVIASRDQFDDWFIEDRTAWQFTPGSAVELAYLLARAIEQPKHVRELSATAAEYVRDHHAVHQLISRLLALYETLTKTSLTAGTPGSHEENGGSHAA